VATVRNIFSSKPETGGASKFDAGSGDWKHYRYDLLPRNRHVVIQLAESDPHQDELTRWAEYDELQAFIAPRTAEDERTDAPIAVRFFVDSRMTPIVGMVPRGLEPVVLEAVSRLEKAGRSTRIPANVVSTRHGLRVNLLMGETR
jgi:hypothetical protein